MKEITATVFFMVWLFGEGVQGQSPVLSSGGISPKVSVGNTIPSPEPAQSTTTSPTPTSQNQPAITPSSELIPAPENTQIVSPSTEIYVPKTEESSSPSSEVVVASTPLQETAVVVDQQQSEPLPETGSQVNNTDAVSGGKVSSTSSPIAENPTSSGGGFGATASALRALPGGPISITPQSETLPPSTGLVDQLQPEEEEEKEEGGFVELGAPPPPVVYEYIVSDEVGDADLVVIQEGQGPDSEFEEIIPLPQNQYTYNYPDVFTYSENNDQGDFALKFYENSNIKTCVIILITFSLFLQLLAV